jgi:serine/threonine-protein kinase
MATGDQPFPGETMTTVSYKIVHTEPIPPAKLNPVIPAQFDKVILKCLAKSPADRYQTGEELARALAEVRSCATPSSMDTAIPQATFVGGDSEATLDATPSLKPNGAAKFIPAAVLVPAESVKLPTQAAPPPSSKRNGLIAGAAVLVAVVAAGGWFAMHHGNSAPAVQPVQQPVDTVPSSTQPGPAPVPAPEPAKANTQPAAQAPPASKSTPSTPATAPASPAATPTPQAQLAPVSFNPRKLDPKQNARLKIDLNHFLPAMDITIAMNGKLYYKGTAGNKAGYDNLYLPPGEHEFRVTVSSGKFQKDSTSMSVRFAAKKHYTLKVDLQPQPSATPGAAIDPATKVVATLKMDLFQF